MTQVVLCLVLALLAATSASHPIKHVITLMMENHSFDNMLGWLKGIGKLTGDEFNVLQASDGSQTKFYVGKGAKFGTPLDPPHGFANVQTQIFWPGPNPVNGSAKPYTPLNQGFVQEYAAAHAGSAKLDPQSIMDCYTPDQVPVISALATSFRTCTRWYSGMPGSTGINRMMAHTAQTDGYTGTAYSSKPVINATSIFESIAGANLTWGIHFHDWTTAHMINPLNTLTEHFHEDYGFETFYQQLKTGTLKNYTYLVPLLSTHSNWTANSQHPTYDIRPGELLYKQVYEALRASEYWNDTLLILTYDEHGGFWDSDNSIPDGVPNPNPQATANPYPFDFTRLGVRVPTILISPWLDPQVDDTIYQHASIPATLKSIFNLPSFLNPRDASAASFDNLWLASPRTNCPTTLPSPPSFYAVPRFVRPSTENCDITQQDQLCTMHGLEDEMTAMYYHLLLFRKLEDRMSLRIGEVDSPELAAEYRREAITVLFRR